MAMVTTGIEQCNVVHFIQLNYLQLHSSTHIFQGWVQMIVIFGMTFNMTTFCHLKGIVDQISILQEVNEHHGPFSQS